MKTWCRFIAWIAFTAAVAPRMAVAEEFLERVQELLSFSTQDTRVRGRLSGMIDLEGYRVQLPAPGVIDTKDGSLLTPRLTVFLDAQLGGAVYVFAQARADHGFDPGEGAGRVRLDEVAVRYSPWGRMWPTVQVGRFATAVGSWANRHDSWTNPFITAPLPYELLTGMWDTDPVRSSTMLLQWSHLRPGLPAAQTAVEKSLRLPIIWGPSYADGVSVFGGIGRWSYVVEGKLGSLSSRPEAWLRGREQITHPTWSGRITYRPNQMWQLGLSASTGAYLREFVERGLAPGVGRGQYRQSVLAHEVAFAWHHWQVWAEAFAARFAIPRVGQADVFSYYGEVRYKFTPQFSGAVRWNEQLYASIPDRGRQTRWGQNVRRVDLAPAYRFTPHTQLKLQYGLQQGDSGGRDTTRTLAAQLTLRF
jgi:hypothetical protein